MPVAIFARWQGAIEATGPWFQPRPDALEYAASAQAIAQTGRVFLQVGPYRVPPRYPPGWPLLLAATLRAGVSAVDLWRVTALFGAALAALLAIVTARAVAALTPDSPGPWPFVAGLAAGWIWAIAPIAVGVGRTLLSDEPTALVAIAALLATAAALLADGGAPVTALGGFCLGLTASLRPVAAVLLAPPLAVLLIGGIGGIGGLRLRGLRPTLARAAAWGLGAAVFPALTVWLLSRSGLPAWEWSAGYRFWVPEYCARLADTFNLRYAVTPDASFPIGQGGRPLSHLGIAARVLLGLPGLRARNYLGLFWPLAGWLAAVPLCFLARSRPVSDRLPWLAAALLLWTLGHVAVFSLYFYPAARFYLVPLALCVFLLATACGVFLARPGWGRGAAGVVLALALGLTLYEHRAMRGEVTPEPQNERTWSRFARWRERSDAERAARVVPFDPVHAQALGLLPPEVVDSVHSWGELPDTAHVRRLRAAGRIP